MQRYLIILSISLLLASCGANSECEEGCTSTNVATVYPDETFMGWFPPATEDTMVLTNGTVTLVYISGKKAELTYNGPGTVTLASDRQCVICRDYISVQSMGRQYLGTSYRASFDYYLSRDVSGVAEDVGQVYQSPSYFEIAMGNDDLNNSPDRKKYKWSIILDGSYPPKSLDGTADFHLSYTIQGKTYDSVYVLKRTTTPGYIEPGELYLRKGTGVLGYKLSNEEKWWRK